MQDIIDISNAQQHPYNFLIAGAGVNDLGTDLVVIPRETK